MIATLGATPVSLAPSGRRRPWSSRQAVWIGPPRQRAEPPPRVRLALGVWIVPKRQRRLNPPAWMNQGLCATMPTKSSDAIFFGVERREAPGALIAAANTARQVCARCPVSTTCLTHALVTGERYGVWGGTSGRQRSKLRLRLEAGAGVDELVAECQP